MSQEIENAYLIGKDTSNFFILETEEGFSRITSWKARIIQWLHLESLLGVVYRADSHGLTFLEERVQRLFKGCEHGDMQVQAKKFRVFASLSQSLNELSRRKSNSLLKEVHRSVSDMALVLFFRYMKSDGERLNEGWYTTYGAIQAGFFVEKCLNSSGERNSREMCERFCHTIVEGFTVHEKVILASFFSRVKEVLPSKEINEVETIYQKRWNRKEYFENVTKVVRNYLSSHRDASPLELAAWLKSLLKDIEEQIPEEAPSLGCYVIDLFQQNVIPWKFKETFRAYGALLGENCDNPIENSFEKSCKHMRKWFSAEGYHSLVLEGLIGQKGKEYCKAVAQSIPLEGYENYLRAYIDQAFGLFSTRAKDIIQGVVTEILLRPVNKHSDEFYEGLGIVFVRMYKEKQEYNKDFSVLTPILGGSIAMPKPAETEEEGEDGALKQMSIHDTEVFSICREGLLKIEQKAVSLMVQEPSFLSFYGNFLAHKMIERARRSKEESYTTLLKELRSFYESFISERFRESAPIIKALQEVLEDDPLQQLDALVSSIDIWKELEAFKKIDEKISKKSIVFCPALEKIAENFCDKFLTACQTAQKIFPQKPPIVFLYGPATAFSLAFLVVAKSLGMQGAGQQFLLNILKKDDRADDVIGWIQAAQSHAQGEYSVKFPIPVLIPHSPPRSWQVSCEEEKKLLDEWLQFIPDPIALEQSLVRSSLKSISINGKPLECSGSCGVASSESERLVQSCRVAEELLEKIHALSRTRCHRQAIGRLLTYAAIDYDPSSVVPANIFDLSIRLDIPCPFLGSGDQSPREAPPTVYGFECKNQKFSVERTAYYPCRCEEKITGWWCVTSKQEIDPGKIGEVSVTFSSRVIPNTRLT